MTNEKAIKTDVLVLGGGLAGCMAAIKAAELGAKVIIFEKAAIKRSGNAGMGMHRICIVHPDYMGNQEFARENVKMGGGLVDEDLSYELAKDSLDRALDLESYGIPVRSEDGTFIMGTSAAISPGKNIFFCPFPKSWQAFKPKMAAKVKDCKVRVLDRTMGLGLLTRDGEVGGEVVGAVGLNTRSGELVICQAKSVILVSGGGYRIYRHPDSSYSPTKFVQCGAPTNCGDGVSAAYHAGARIINMEFLKESPVWKDYEHWGIGPIMALGARPLDGKGKVFVEPDPRFKDIPVGANLIWSYHKEIVEKARGPFYMDTTCLTEDQSQFLMELLENESAGYLDYLKAKGLNLKKDLVEFEMHPPYLHNYQAGIHTDVNAKSSIDGLYAAGDCHGGGWRYSSTGAFVFGARAGTDAAKRSPRVSHKKVDRGQVKTIRKLIGGVSDPRNGLNWESLEDKVRRIVSDYAGHKKNEAKLLRGLERLEKIRHEYLPRILVRNPREMMRAAEVRCIFDIAEMHLRAALFRKESRILPLAIHYRVDYPERNDEKWLKHTVIQKKKEMMSLSTKKPRRLKD